MNSTKESSEQFEGITGHYPVKQGFRGKSLQKVHPNVLQNLCHTVSLWYLFCPQGHAGGFHGNVIYSVDPEHPESEIHSFYLTSAETHDFPNMSGIFHVLSTCIQIANYPQKCWDQKIRVCHTILLDLNNS